MARKIKPGTRVRRSKCETCVMRTPGCHLAPGRLAEIQCEALRGVTWLCHHDNNLTACRGIRDFQLQVFARMGLIAAPTDAALRAAMAAAGVAPGSHI